MMKEIYQSYATYNLWANKRIIEVFRPLPGELIEKRVPSSFPSARLTLLHIHNAENIWLKRLQGLSPQALGIEDFKGTHAEVFQLLEESSTAMLEFVKAQTDDFFSQKIVYKASSSGEQAQYAFQVIHHCFNHSTYHRGQLINIGRQLGLEKLPQTDYIFFLRSTGNQ